MFEIGLLCLKSVKKIEKRKFRREKASSGSEENGLEASYFLNGFVCCHFNFYFSIFKKVAYDFSCPATVAYNLVANKCLWMNSKCAVSLLLLLLSYYYYIYIMFILYLCYFCIIVIILLFILVLLHLYNYIIFLIYIMLQLLWCNTVDYTTNWGIDWLPVYLSTRL